MKKFVVSMGLAAAGSAAFQMTCAAQLLSSDAPKWWNVSASLSGFYDNNYSTTPKDHGSYGLEFSPTASVNVPLTQTQLGLIYTYDLQYYEQRDHLNVNPYDQSHSFSLWLQHSFNERWSGKLTDAFVDSQEPELLANGASVGAEPYRLNGNNIANTGTAELDTEWSREFSTALTYGNSVYYYNNSTNQFNGGSTYAAELNRLQNNISLDAQWHLGPETMVFVGDEFSLVNYTGNGVIGTYQLINKTYKSDSRDSYSDFGYVGVQRNLLPNLVVAAKAGLQYNDAYNNPLYSQTGITPYADVSLIYTYLVGCNAQIGFTEVRNATDVVSVNQSNGSITQDQLSSSLHASINHHITQKLLVSAVGSFTSSTYDGGGYANEVDDQYSTGLSAIYSFTRNFSGNVTYNYDNLQSNLPGRGYQRNRVAIGLTVSY
jgi:hypothetical protein